MTWEQKFAAIKALDSEAALSMRGLGDWYVVTHKLELKNRDGDGVLQGLIGSGSTPMEAAEDCWARLNGVSPTGYVVIGGFTEARRHVRWNGFMWEDVSHIYPTRRQRSA